MNDSAVMTALEDLAATFPWDGTSIWIGRTPDCSYSYTAILERNENLGLEWDCTGGHKSPSEAVAEMKRRWLHKRDPELARRKKIHELREKIAKLQQVIIGLPPYQPNRELAEFVPVAPAGPVIEVESTKDDVPF